MRGTRYERLAGLTTKGPDCWEWTGWLSRKGYGVLQTSRGRRGAAVRKMEYAHRVAYEQAHGAIPVGAMVCHTCDNRRCVNPGHLYLGTALENNRDREARGRRTRFRGSLNGQAILTETEVLAMRARRAEGTLYRLIAAEFGRKETTVIAAVTGQNWRHI